MHTLVDQHLRRRWLILACSIMTLGGLAAPSSASGQAGQGGTIVGRVTDARTGTGIERATVQVQTTRLAGTTDSGNGGLVGKIILRSFVRICPIPCPETATALGVGDKSISPTDNDRFGYICANHVSIMQAKTNFLFRNRQHERNGNDHKGDHAFPGGVELVDPNLF